VSAFLDGCVQWRALLRRRHEQHERHGQRATAAAERLGAMDATLDALRYEHALLNRALHATAEQTHQQDDAMVVEGEQGQSKVEEVDTSLSVLEASIRQAREAQLVTGELRGAVTVATQRLAAAEHSATLLTGGLRALLTAAAPLTAQLPSLASTLSLSELPGTLGPPLRRLALLLAVAPIAHVHGRLIALPTSATEEPYTRSSHALEVRLGRGAGVVVRVHALPRLRATLACECERATDEPRLAALVLGDDGAALGDARLAYERPAGWRYEASKGGRAYRWLQRLAGAATLAPVTATATVDVAETLVGYELLAALLKRLDELA